MCRQCVTRSRRSCAQGFIQRTYATRSPASEATMRLDFSDWIVLALYGIVCVAIGLAVVRRASSGRAEFFLSGRRLSWWLLGVSLVATTFSTDTPNLVTDLVRTGGVSQNWVWWAFAITGMCTVFFYAKLWRRSAALTDIAFYESRYSGKPAAFLRGFRAIYLGVFFNVMIMASVNLSATKIAGVMLGWDRSPAMRVYLPHGLLGLMVASLAAAYMSTISTHLNWGASYAVEDCYRRFMAPDKTERHYVMVGRAVTVGLIVLASAVSLWLHNSYQAFQILLQIGAGTGLIFLLRWFWWRINAWSEIAGMGISFVVAIYFQFVHTALGFAPLAPTVQLVIGIAITTVGWLVVTFLTPPTDRATLQAFYDRIRPMGPGWKAAVTTRPPNPGESVSAAFLCWFLGVAVIYAALFGTGYLLYGNTLPAIVCLVAAGAAAWGLFRALPRVGFE